MKIHIASAFDKNFVARALTTYKSILPYIKGANFWFLCLDDQTKLIMEKINLPNVSCISVEELKNKELVATKLERNNIEFAMTSKSNFLSYLINSKKVEEGDLLILTDVDMFFYHPIKKFIEKEKNNTKYSIFLTPHKFPKEKERLIPEVGYYNGGFITFRINETSKACIHKWAKQCINWCYLWHDYINGWHTDQMYIDSWKKEFPGVLDLPDKGINMGTWNIGRYNITQDASSSFWVDEDPLVCYHFHGLKMYLDRKDKIKPYPICVYNEKIYNDYTKALQKSYDELVLIDQNWKYGFVPHPGILRIIKQKIWKKIF